MFSDLTEVSIQPLGCLCREPVQCLLAEGDTSITWDFKSKTNQQKTPATTIKKTTLKSWSANVSIYRTRFMPCLCCCPWSFSTVPYILPVPQLSYTTMRSSEIRAWHPCSSLGGREWAAPPIRHSTTLAKAFAPLPSQRL